MQRFLGRTYVFSALLGLMLVFISGSALAQYQSLNLVSNLAGKAPHQDPLLQNAWGLVYGPGGPFWVSDEADGWSTLYDGKGDPQSLQVVVPAATGSGPGSPTGIVYNGSNEFAIDSWVSVFLFATLDGTIQGWSSFNTASSLIAVSSPGAAYTGLAITNKPSGNYLFAADTANNKIDIYDGSFNLVSSVSDPAIPAGFSVFGIQDINGKVYVSYAASNGGPGGYIDVFGENGTLEEHFAHGKPLNQPWGFALAPANFGPLSNALLISNNNSTGAIVGYNPNTRKLVGAMKDTTGHVLTIDGLWGIEFGGGTASNGKANQLYYTAGPNDTNGYFGLIAFK